MKKIRDLFKNPDFQRVDGVRRRVFPFPGKYPTRWRIWRGGGDLGFITKPTPLVIQMCERLHKAGKSLYMEEFDKLGVFRTASSENRYIRCFYYPWHGPALRFFDNWRIPVFFKQMRLNGRIFFIYSPFEKMDDEHSINSLREYKKWVKSINPWK